MTSATDLAGYSYDGALDRGRPDAVVLARSVADVRETVRWCVRNGVPFTARGAGTNLSGGCIALKGGVVLSTARMDRILQIDGERGIALAEPGVVNLALQREAAKVGRFYAPDPASQRVCTIGGNVAENAGGPRCLKYGVTVNHVLALEAVLPDGSLERFTLEDSGCEFMSLLVGSEGTLGVVTKAWLRLTPEPEGVRTLLAGFSSIEAAAACVAAIVAKGIIPRVLEAMDKTTVDSVEAFLKAGYPSAEAVLLIELDGRARDVDREGEAVEGLCRSHGAGEFRSASEPAARERLWEGRRGAYAAMARLAPNVLVEDGVVPRDKLPAVVGRIREITSRHGLTAGLLFHAGDGNIHPNIAYDERDAEQTARVKLAGHEILRACVELGGSLSGEHGIGVDKREAMAWLFTPRTLELFRAVKNAVDPKGLANPDKLFPLGSGGAEGKSFRRPQPRPLGEAAGFLVEKVRAAGAGRRPMIIRGSGSRLVHDEPGLTELRTTGMNRVVDLDMGNFTTSAEAGISLRFLHIELKTQGVYLRLPDLGGTLGGLLATKAWPGAREDLLGMKLLLADGSVVEFGGKVMKNVAGYDLSRLVLGSWGTLGVILEATFKVYAAPQDIAAGNGEPKAFAAGSWQRRIKDAFDPGNLLNPWLHPG